MTEPPCCRWVETTLMLELAVRPGAKQDEIGGMHGGRLKLRIKAPAIEGRANDYLVAFLAESFGVPRAAVQIIRGATHRMKTVQIASPQRIPAAIQALASRPMTTDVHGKPQS